MRGKRMFVCGFLVVIGTLFIFLSSDFAQGLFTPKKVNYDELSEGDVIPFDSTLGIDAFFPSKDYFDGKPSDGIWEGMYDLKVSGAINLYWCKDETCLESKQYDAQKEVLKVNLIDNGAVYDQQYSLVSFDNSAEVNVSNYDDVFKEQGNKYIGWKVHFIDSDVLKIDYYVLTGFWGEIRQLGNYQNIVLTPISQEDCNCVNYDDTVVEYYFEKKVDITKSPWYKENVINNYEDLSAEANLTSWKQPASFSFEADKGDKLVLRMKTATPNLKITLDGKEQSLPDMFYKDKELAIDNINPNRYYDYEFEISNDGEHTLVVTYLGNDKYSFPYVYLEDLRILKLIKVEEVTEDKSILKISTCKNGYREITRLGTPTEEEPKSPNPNTGDNILQYGLLFGLSLMFLFIGYIIRKKVNS